jgi:hypothetical protein
MWNMTVLDIEKTLSSVITKVTHDHAVDAGTVKKRKEALLALGAYYSAYGVPMDVGLSDIKGKLSEQMKSGAAAAASRENAASSSSGSGPSTAANS